MVVLKDQSTWGNGERGMEVKGKIFRIYLLEQNDSAGHFIV
jgi:hypothetical protein